MFITILNDANYCLMIKLYKSFFNQQTLFEDYLRKPVYFQSFFVYISNKSIIIAVYYFCSQFGRILSGLKIFTMN